MSIPLTSPWNLEELFTSKDGLASFFTFMDRLKEEGDQLSAAIARPDLIEALTHWQLFGSHLRQAFSYIACLGVDNPLHPQLETCHLLLLDLEKSRIRSAVDFDFMLASIPQDDFEKLPFKQSELLPFLRKRREQIRPSLSPIKDPLIDRLVTIGLTGSEEVYRSIIARSRVVIAPTKSMTLHQAQLLLRYAYSSLTAEDKESLTSRFEEAYLRQAPAFAALINETYDLRLEQARSQGHKDLLESTLSHHRLSRVSLETMWRVLDDKKGSLLLFLSKKALFFKRKRPLWYEIFANITQPQTTPLPLKEATHWIQAALSRLDREVANLVRQLWEQSAIATLATLSKEASKSANEQFLASFTLPFPLQKKVRVFLDYQEDPQQLLAYLRQMMTAWRFQLLDKWAHPIQGKSIIVNEALNVLGERLLLEIAKERSFTRQLHFDVLFPHLQRALSQLLDSQVNFLFESSLCREKGQKAYKKGEGLPHYASLSLERLNELMRQSQLQAYANQLGSYFPLYWATQESYFQAAAPAFQNFASAIGFLLGIILYNYSRKHPEGFYQKLRSWVELSSMTGEAELQLSRLFGLKLDQELVWQEAMALLEEDIRTLANLIDTKDRTFMVEMGGY